jgi:hypothetical protein
MRRVDGTEGGGVAFEKAIRCFTLALTFSTARPEVLPDAGPTSIVSE